MLHVSAVACAALLVGCGPSAATGPLNPLFGGTWYGTATQALSDGNGTTYSAQWIGAVSGNLATLTAVCLDATGSLPLTGSGDSATFSGNYSCPPVAFLGCSSVVLSYSMATATLVPGTPSHLSVVASGNVAGCQVTDTLATTFVGDN